MRSKSKKALQGPNESQDSQGVVHQYVNEFGIEATSSSPSAESTSLSTVRTVESATSKQRTVRTDEAGGGATGMTGMTGVSTPNTSTTSRNLSADQLAPPSLLTVETEVESNVAQNVKQAKPESNQIRDLVPDLAADEHEPELRKPRSRSRRIAKMDVSQSPTQTNDDRDYVSACHKEIGSDELSTYLTDTSHGDEPRTLLDEETGAVNFGTLGVDGQNGPVSPSSDILSPIQDPKALMARGSWRGCRASQQHSSYKLGTSPAMPSATAPVPETPAGAVNPFGARPPPSVFHATQMFNQATQFSSAVKRFSPTSSRPSPNNFQNFLGTTPLAGLVTSPLKGHDGTSSPSVAIKEAHHQERSPCSPQEDAGKEPASPSNIQPTSTLDKDEIIPESPSSPAHSARLRRGPLSEYEPVATSQQRKSSNDVLEDATELEDSSDEKRWRQQRARRKREEAERKLSQISVPRANRVSDSPQGRRKPARTTSCQTRKKQSFDTDDGGKGIIPDSQPRQSSSAVDDEAGRDQLVVGGLLAGGYSEKPEGEAQTATDPSSRPSTDSRVPETSPAGQASRIRASHRESSFLGDDVWIGDVATTESAPGPSDEVPPKSLGTWQNPRKRKSTALENAPAAVPSSISNQQEAQSTEDGSLVPTTTSPRQHKTATALGDVPESSSPLLSLPSSGEITNRKRPRRQARGSIPATPLAEMKLKPQRPRRQASTSSLSVLSSTPSVTTGASTSPVTDPFVSPINDGNEAGPTSSGAEPPVPKRVGAGASAGDRARTLTRTRTVARTGAQLPEQNTKVGTAKKPRVDATSLRRQALQEPPSPDELASAPVSGGFENSMVHPRMTATRSGWYNDGGARAGARAGAGAGVGVGSGVHGSRGHLFNNMAFAISFQARQAGEKETDYKDRCKVSIELGELITREGGRVLATGFNELFDMNSLDGTPDRTHDNNDDDDDVDADADNRPSSSLSLKRDSQSLGFTALIADGHSRKVKYMQALALGLPCLAYQWVTTCLDRGTLVDWAPYLLCAGQSVCLGNAIRSRLLAPYPAADAKLAEIFNQRQRLLGNNRILLVLKKSRNEESKMAYVFLARVLGAGLSRVYSVAQARTALKESEEKGARLDWVYVDEQTGTEEELFGSGPGPNPPAKKPRRARRSGPAAPAAPKSGELGLKRVRCLSNELVIQSLIMGRMIDEGEWRLMEQ